MKTARYNFSEARFLIMDSNRAAGRMVASIVSGFGAGGSYILYDPHEAKLLIETGMVDAAVMTLGRQAEEMLEMIRSVRANASCFSRYIPIIVLTGQARLDHVARARDAGASFVVRRPISPQVLFARLIWSKQISRGFIDAPLYAGPDRRFRAAAAPSGRERRKAGPARASVVEL
jgi:DNA-binding response OmpR family regulator